jgi:2-polyprenyl-6-methoxyphenol hydroxylase-like FAD-dependent oxidoreductase
MTELVHDVAIVGFGPVGQTLAALLGGYGVDVVVVERFVGPYGLPRAVRFDHEAMRIWQQLGIAEQLQDDAVPVNRYEWFGADGNLSVRFDFPEDGPSGWPWSHCFYQPYLEAALERSAREQPSVDLERGWTLVDLTPTDEAVDLQLERTRGLGGQADGDEQKSVRARYVVGADGANSAARAALAIDFEDLGFSERWFVVDMLTDEHVAQRFDSFPIQFCDPTRPHMMCPNGRGHRRWEFMLLEHERAEDFERPEDAWALLAPWMSSDEGQIVRQAVYEFRSGVATSWQAGRCFLAGDSAHLMPPHMGEGMCSGLRDAANLAWKLAVVIRGAAGPHLLTSYAAERRPHARALVELSQVMGKISCELDPQAAAQRDAQLRAGPPVVAGFPSMGDGLRYRGPGSVELGGLSVQGVVDAGGHTGRFDDVVGRGFVLLASDGDPGSTLSSDQLTALERLQVRLVSLGSGAGAIRDVDGTMTDWLKRHSAAAVLIRPDFYVFGAVQTPQDISHLVADLLAQLWLEPTAARPLASR